MFIRIGLLLSITWVMGLTEPFFTMLGQEISGRDLILIVGGLFLIAKSTHEIHDKLEGEEGHSSAKVAASFAAVIVQILLLDIVFSLDSVITAVGMAEHVAIGVSLIGEGFEQHIPKGYIYFAMGFSVFVEMINLRVRKKSTPVHLHQSYTE
jgi:predicted tellurium resistance membrane protein TerC